MESNEKDELLMAQLQKLKMERLERKQHEIEIKETTGECEICGKKDVILCFKKLDGPDSYQKPYGHLVLCQDCNYRFYLAYEMVMSKYEEIIYEFCREIRPHFAGFMKKLAEAETDAIIGVVGTRKVRKRPSIDRYFGYNQYFTNYFGTNTLQGLLYQLSYFLGAWDARAGVELRARLLGTLRTLSKVNPLFIPTDDILDEEDLPDF